MTQNLPSSPLQMSEEKKIMKKFKEGKDFDIGTIHLAAYLLDPSLQGSLLDSMQLLEAINSICQCTQHMDLEVMKVRENVTDYRDKEGLFSQKFLWEEIHERDKKNRPLL